MKVQLIRYHDLDNTNTRLAESLNKKQGVLPPLGIAYVASSLEKAGFDEDPKAFKRYGSARQLYNFKVDNASAY